MLDPRDGSRIFRWIGVVLSDGASFWIVWRFSPDLSSSILLLVGVCVWSAAVLASPGVFRSRGYKAFLAVCLGGLSFYLFSLLFVLIYPDPAAKDASLILYLLALALCGAACYGLWGTQRKPKHTQQVSSGQPLTPAERQRMLQEMNTATEGASLRFNRTEYFRLLSHTHRVTAFFWNIPSYVPLARLAQMDDEIQRRLEEVTARLNRIATGISSREAQSAEKRLIFKTFEELLHLSRSCGRGIVRTNTR